MYQPSTLILSTGDGNFLFMCLYFIGLLSAKLSLALHRHGTSGVREKRHDASKPSNYWPNICDKLSKNAYTSRYLPKECKQGKQRVLPAKYLPNTDRVKAKNIAEFKLWSEKFLKEQQQWCGTPTSPIQFEKSRETFADAAVDSWPWMVSRDALVSR